MSVRRQCAKCPWKVSTDPREIPDGYCERKHAALAGTIAEPGSLRALTRPLRVMACHETKAGRELPCVGWFHNQMCDGNNLALRLAVMRGDVDSNVRVVGPQHATLEDTLPKKRAAAKRRRRT